MTHNKFFIGDTHFGHSNILTFQRSDGRGLLRPGFSSIEEHDELLVANWNSVVRPQDKVYHLGDVSIKKGGLEIIKRLNGHKRLIGGNHDIFRTRDYLEAGFEEISGYRVIDKIIFSHIPIHVGSLGRYRANVHGHLHDNRVTLDSLEGNTVDPRYLCVSVEHVDYIPRELQELKDVLSERGNHEN